MGPSVFLVETPHRPTLSSRTLAPTATASSVVLIVNPLAPLALHRSTEQHVTVAPAGVVTLHDSTHFLVMLIPLPVVVTVVKQPMAVELVHGPGV